jgi:hypothetical protein
MPKRFWHCGQMNWTGIGAKKRRVQKEMTVPHSRLTVSGQSEQYFYKILP